ncbi:MAG: VWA domain-containing protein [Thermodesulfobacteriota bacterium]
MKKRVQYPLLAALLLIFLSSCSDNNQPSQVSAPPVETEHIEETKNDLLTKKKEISESLPMSRPVSPQMQQKNRPPKSGKILAMAQAPAPAVYEVDRGGFLPPRPPGNMESYNALEENRFISAQNDPLSTFSIDVDSASYANVRRFINSGQLPPVGAVRVEEMINYFSYDYPVPQKGPFSLTAELGPAPWKPAHQLVRIGLKAKDIDRKGLPPSNLVFLIDVSGSMNQPNKLPLLKKSLNLLIDQLGEKDRVAIVVYAGSDRVVLKPTPGSEKEKIRLAVDTLQSGGSTHGSQGIVTAYKLAEQTMMPNGNNRVILASDGDFNVGLSSRDELQQLIEEKRKSGVYLTVLGFGMGNYHDDTMEILADKGNGNYGYIDSLLEAKKILVREMSGTLFALANDVKIQVEFNPALVEAYRLIGYENRKLADEDFNDDKKDAGEIGVGHTVTALYEIIPKGVEGAPTVDPLKYRKPAPARGYSNELLTVKLRYKPSGQPSSTMISRAITQQSIPLAKTSNDFRFAASVAGFGMLLKESDHIGEMKYAELLKLARTAKGTDANGYRAEFIRLVELGEMLAKK